MARPEKPSAQYVVNGWYFMLPGLTSPHFETLAGLNKKTGSVSIVDGGSNITYKFSDQIKDFGQITLSRTKDGSLNDKALNVLADASMELGTKYAGVLVKEHFGREVYRIAFEGLCFIEHNRPDYQTSGTEKETIQYVATVDTWVEI